MICDQIVSFRNAKIQCSEIYVRLHIYIIKDNRTKYTLLETCGIFDTFYYFIQLKLISIIFLVLAFINIYKDL